jgi:hypothetical protein
MSLARLTFLDLAIRSYLSPPIGDRAELSLITPFGRWARSK